VTTRSFKQAKCRELAGGICDILDHVSDADVEAEAAGRETQLNKRFPAYPG
jgi:glycine hydroxymethyltransferase